MVAFRQSWNKVGNFEKSSFIAKVKYWFNNLTHVVKSKKHNLIFMHRCLNYKDLRTNVTGDTLDNLIYLIFY